MAFLDFFRAKPSAVAEPRVKASSSERVFVNMNDPALLELLRGGATSVSVDDALKNTAVLRSVDLIAGVMGRLPLHLRRKDASGKVMSATDHPLYSVLMHRPNARQNAHQFKRLMQTWLLIRGNAYALIVRSGRDVIALNPIHPDRVTPVERSDFSLVYDVTMPGGMKRTYQAQDILHLSGNSDDGKLGWSPVKQAADVITAHVLSQRAAARVFDNGMMVGGNLSHPGKLSNEAYERLKASMEERSGAENAGRWIITEEGMTAAPFASTAVDAQLVEFRRALVEDIARVFGVPRPLLMIDDTSWGSGIEQLAILFVRFGLAPWFDVWEQGLKTSCLRPSEWEKIYPDFDERELLRGTIKEQFEAYAKAAGSGGHKPFMEPNEIREDLGLGAHTDGAGLKSAGDLKNEQNRAA